MQEQMKEVVPPIPAPVLILGIGHAGAQVLLQLRHDSGEDNTLEKSFRELKAIDVDRSDVQENQRQGLSSLLIGEETTYGHGVHGDEELAEQCMESAMPELEKLLEGRRMLIVVSGIGGCIGGALEPLLKLAEEINLPAVLVCMKPLPFEDPRRLQRAEQVLQQVEMFCQLILAVPGELLMPQFASMTAPVALSSMLRQVAEAVVGLTVPFRSGMLHGDPGILRFVTFEGSCLCQWAVARSGRQGTPQTLLADFQRQPLMTMGTWRKRVERGLLLLRTASTASLDQIAEISGGIRKLLPPNAGLEIVLGEDAEMEDTISLLFLALCIPEEQAALQAEVPSFSSAGENPILLEDSLGIFQGDPRDPRPEYEDLDQPVFLRRKITIDRGR